MKYIFLTIGILVFFACKMEKIEPINKIDLNGKIKSITPQLGRKQEFIYNDTTGQLWRVEIFDFNSNDTLDGLTIERNTNKIFIYPDSGAISYVDYFDIIIDNEGLIKTFKSWFEGRSKNFITFNYTNKLNYFSDLGTTNGRYDRFKIIDGNYTSFIHQYTSDFGYPVKDTFSITYTNLPYNKYAPLQKLLIYQSEILDYLGYDDNYLFPQNKNLIDSIHINGERIYDFEYEFNSLNQLVKTYVTSNGGLQEYTIEYY